MASVFKERADSVLITIPKLSANAMIAIRSYTANTRSGVALRCRTSCSVYRLFVRRKFVKVLRLVDPSWPLCSITAT